MIAVAFATAPAFGVTDGSCPPEHGQDTVSDLALVVGEAARLQSFTSTAYVQREQDTTFDLHDATETNGNRGKIGTAPFSPEEIAEIDAIEAKLPKCVVDKANIVRAYRAKRGAAAEKLGIVGIAYAYNNGTYNKEEGKSVRGGQLIITDLFLDKNSFDKLGTGDEQMQVAMGWTTCQPPKMLSQAELADVSTRAKTLPDQLKKLSRERIFFHEHIHGVTHEQEESDWTDPNSVEGFFGPNGASRFAKLRGELYQAGGKLEQLNQKLRNVRSREEYCSIYAERSDYLKSKGVPQRWPGDTHALDDRDEYVTILIEQMMYDKNGMTGYSAEEKKWAENWWNYTFNPAYKAKAPYVKIPFGTCVEGARYASPSGTREPSSSAYGPTQTVGGW